MPDILGPRDPDIIDYILAVGVVAVLIWTAYTLYDCQFGDRCVYQPPVNEFKLEKFFGLIPR